MSGHRHFMPDGEATGFAAKPAVGGALVVGEIITVVGACTLTRPDGDPFPIKAGDPICVGDIIETTAGGRVGIRFIDGTAFNLSDSARVVVKEFGGDGADACALFDISRGTFVFIAGEMAELGGLRIETPFASLRGRAQSRGMGMLSLASLFFSALESAQGATSPPGIEDGIINLKESSDIINAPFGIIEITIGGVTQFLDTPFEQLIVGASGSVSRAALTPTEMIQLTTASIQVGDMRGGNPTVGGPSGSGGLSSPVPPPSDQQTNTGLPPPIVIPGPPGGPSGPPSSQDLIIPPPPAAASTYDFDEFCEGVGGRLARKQSGQSSDESLIFGQHRR